MAGGVGDTSPSWLRRSSLLLVLLLALAAPRVRAGLLDGLLHSQGDSGSGKVAQLALGDLPALSVCDVVKNREKYDGKVISLHADLVLLPESAVLIDDDHCDEPHGIRLVVGDELSASSEYAAMITKVASSHMKGHVVIVGLYKKNGFEGDGSFFLRKIR